MMSCYLYCNVFITFYIYVCLYVFVSRLCGCVRIRFGVTPTDTVGAGDSFLARLLSGLLDGEAPDSALAGANALGAFVATQNGATPIHNKDAINKLLSGSVLTA